MKEFYPNAYVREEYIDIYYTCAQKFQFNRLLIEIDRLVGNGMVKDEVFAQIGYSDYTSKNYSYKEFLNQNEFSKIIGESDIVIIHGGIGAII